MDDSPIVCPVTLFTVLATVLFAVIAMLSIYKELSYIKLCTRYIYALIGPRSGELRTQKLVELLDKDNTAYGVEINPEKTKLITNSTSGINTQIRVSGQKLDISYN